MSEITQQSVLIIDDSQDIHQLISARLGSERVSLLHAYNAAEGLEAVQRHKPDLVLLDVDMPHTDGMTLCRTLKEDPEVSYIPVIFLTGTMDTPTKVQAFELGAVDYITKPFDAVELKARVRAALRTKRYHDLLTTKAQIDALTGLWNRGYLNDQLAVDVSVVKRNMQPLSLIMVDIDHFKAINDTYGHPFGDKVIQGIAAAFSELSRDSDVVCRYGGEEFAIILRNTSASGALIIAERLRLRLAKLDLRAGRQQVPITASFGLASNEQFEDQTQLAPEILLKAADEALYKAKAEGRDRVVCWS